MGHCWTSFCWEPFNIIKRERVEYIWWLWILNRRNGTIIFVIFSWWFCKVPTMSLFPSRDLLVPSPADPARPPQAIPNWYRRRHWSSCVLLWAWISAGTSSLSLPTSGTSSTRTAHQTPFLWQSVPPRWIYSFNVLANVSFIGSFTLPAAWLWLFVWGDHTIFVVLRIWIVGSRVRCFAWRWFWWLFRRAGRWIRIFRPVAQEWVLIWSLTLLYYALL